MKITFQIYFKYGCFFLYLNGEHTIYPHPCGVIALIKNPLLPNIKSLAIQQLTSHDLYSNMIYHILYDTFHKQRAISIPNWSNTKKLQNIDIYGPYTCFAYSHIIGGHKNPEKVTRSHCYGRFIGRKSPQNTHFLPFLLA